MSDDLYDTSPSARAVDGLPPSTAAEEVMAVLRPVCGALIASVALFGGVVAFLFVAGTAPLDPLLGEGVLVAAAAFMAVMFGLALVLERRNKEAPRGASVAEVATRFQTGSILGFALREGAGLIALVLTMMFGSLAWAVGFAAATVAVMTLTWPSKDELEARLRRASAGT